MGATQEVGLQRLAQPVVLQQEGKTGQGALFERRARQARQRRPDGAPGFGIDIHAFLAKATLQPFGRPGAIAFARDTGQWLESDFFVATQVVVFATQAQHRGPQGLAQVEKEQARAGIAAELHGQGRQQDRLAHPGGADHQRVPHITDMGDQAERCGAVGTRHHQRRTIKVCVARRTCPDSGYRHEVDEVQGRNERLAHVCVSVAGNG
ncbi:hypothetical protein D9M69_449750 [compost metagenome]